jgi:two-component system sensor histidine kinase NreB
MDILTREVPIKEGPSLDRVNAVKEIIDETLKEIRQMAFDLRPPALDELGLPSALRLYVSRFGQQAGIETQISTPPSLEIADKRVESVLYRVTQESLTNVARHASATLVAVRLGLHEGLLRLEIEDNGRGFILPQVSAPFSPGLGILGMKERVTDLGGSFVLSSQEGKGTHITVEIPQSQIL